MRRTRMPRIASSIAGVAALSLVAMGCGSDDETIVDSGASTVDTDAAPAETAATTGMVDEPGNPEVSVSSTVADEPTVSTGSTDPSDSIDDPDTSAAGHTSDDLQDYIDSLAATTDNFDGLTTTPDETICAATAVLTPLGVDLLQSENVSVENVDLELDLLEFATPESAVGIADGLVACGLGTRFAASLAESETAEDLDAAQQLELRTCVQAMLDEPTSHSLLVGFLTPSTTAGETVSPERTDAGEQMAGMVRDCGFDARFYP
jgi:hypothetical protein